MWCGGKCLDATDIVGGTRKLRSDELHNLSFLPNISSMTKLTI